MAENMSINKAIYVFCIMQQNHGSKISVRVKHGDLIKHGDKFIGLSYGIEYNETIHGRYISK